MALAVCLFLYESRHRAVVLCLLWRDHGPEFPLSRRLQDFCVSVGHPVHRGKNRAHSLEWVPPLGFVWLVDQFVDTGSTAEKRAFKGIVVSRGPRGFCLVLITPLSSAGILPISIQVS